MPAQTKAKTKAQTPSELLETLRQISKEVNEQFVTVNRLDEFEEVAAYLHDFEKQFVQNKLFLELNNLFDDYLQKHDLSAAEAMTERDKEKWLALAQHHVEAFRKELVRDGKYLPQSVEIELPAAEGKKYTRNGINNLKEIEALSQLNLPELFEHTLYQNKKMSLEYEGIEQLLQQQRTLGEARKGGTHFIRFCSQSFLAHQDLTPQQKLDLDQIVNYISYGVYLDHHKIERGQCGEHVALSLVKMYQRGVFNQPNITVKVLHGDYVYDNIHDDNHVSIIIFPKMENDEESKIILGDPDTYPKGTINYDSWKGEDCVYKAEDHLSHRYIEFGGEIHFHAVTIESALIKNIYHSASKSNQLMQMTGHHSREEFDASLINEYQLIEIEKAQLPYTYKIIHSLIEKMNLSHLFANMKIYLTLDKLSLVSIIEGFADPAVAISCDMLKQLDETYSKEELLFAVVRTMLAMHYFGNEDNLMPNEHFMLDKSALDICGNGEAAISYLQKAARKEEENEKPILVKILNTSTMIKPDPYTARIKNLRLLFAQNKDYLQPKITLDDDTSLIRSEVSQFKNNFFYTDDFNQKATLVDKIKYLEEQLPTLKENEILPYELKLVPGLRVREFCQLIYGLNIDFSNPLQELEINAANQLLDKAFLLRVPGFDRIYTAFQNFDFGFYTDGRNNLIPLGPFKLLQEAIYRFFSAQNLQSAKYESEQILQLYEQTKNHFTKFPAAAANEYVKLYQQQHQGNSPFGSDRYFGSGIGTQIAWKRTNNLEHITELLKWSAEDSSSTIAKALYLCGVNVYAEVLDKLPNETLDTVVNPVLIQEREINFTDNIHNYGMKNSYLYRHFVIDCLSKRHVLNTTMFNEAISFDEKFIRFFDHNLPMLEHTSNYDNIQHHNSDNHAVHFLLNEFAKIAVFGSENDKKIVKSFFLGREDKRDLAHLLDDGHGYNLTLDSFYYQFCFYQRYLHDDFNLFTMDESIELVKQYLDEKSVPPQLLANIFKINYDNFSLTFLKEYFSHIEKAKIFITNLHQLEVITQHLAKYTYDLYSPEAVDIIKLLIETNSLYYRRIGLETMRQVVPGEYQLGRIAISDLILLYRVSEQAQSVSLSFQKQMGELIFDQVKRMTNKADKLLALESFLTTDYYIRTLPLVDLNLRNHIILLWANTLKELYGLDDQSQPYLEQMKLVIQRLMQTISNRDIDLIFEALANIILSQQEVSEYIGVTLAPHKYLRRMNEAETNKKETIISNVNMATAALQQSSDDQKECLDFLTSPLSESSCDRFANFLHAHNKHDDFVKQLGFGDYSGSVNGTKVALQNFYANFWDATLINRTIAIESLILPASKVLSEEDVKAAYEQALHYVSDKLFPEAAIMGSEDQVAFDFLVAYLESANKFEKSLLLSSLLVVTNAVEQNGEHISTGKKLALLCEHLGPPYKKMLQIINSHPETSPELKKDTAHVKSQSDLPKRHDIFRLMQETVPDETLKQIKHVGLILGAASYNIAINVELTDGRKVVLILLREQAEQLAKEGYAHLRNAINICKNAKIQTKSKMALMMIDEAEALSHSEMDHYISDIQFDIAKKIYSEVKMTVPINGINYQVEFHPAGLIESGQGYRLIEKMGGIEFNNLPENTAEEKNIKRGIAYAVITKELENMLSGQYFDDDRHGNQLCVEVDPMQKRINLNLYDFGEMATTLPEPVEITQFANVIKELNQLIKSQKTTSSDMDALLSHHIDLAVSHQQPYHYLLRIRKGMLALQDFQQHLRPSDMVDIITNVAVSSDKIHPELMSAFPIELKAYHFAKNIKKGIVSAFSIFTQANQVPQQERFGLQFTGKKGP